MFVSLQLSRGYTLLSFCFNLLFFALLLTLLSQGLLRLFVTRTTQKENFWIYQRARVAMGRLCHAIKYADKASVRGCTAGTHQCLSFLPPAIVHKIYSGAIKPGSSMLMLNHQKKTKIYYLAQGQNPWSTNALHEHDREAKTDNQEIVEFVTELDVKYGQCVGKKWVNHYVLAEQVEDWSKICMVQIHLGLKQAKREKKFQREVALRLFSMEM